LTHNKSLDRPRWSSAEARFGLTTKVLLKRHQKIALFVGPAVAAFVALVPTPEGLAPEGQRGLAILALCVIWWLLTPVALPVTSLLGMALLPLLGVLAPNEAFAFFGNQAVFFVVGVFLIAAAMLRSGLSARLALWAMRFLARSENALCAAVLGLSALMCLVVVSHAVAALMLPIVLGLVRALDLRPRSATARRLILSLAWGSIIGSNLTLFASARASLALQVYGTQGESSSLHAAPIGVLQFTAATAGIVLILLVMTYGLLRWLYPPEGIDMEPAVARLDEKVGELGGFSSKEWKTLLVIAAMVPSLVLLAPEYGLGTVAIAFSAALFGLGVLEWESAERYVNWGIVLLYGGAIAIGAGLAESGAMEWVGDYILPAEGSSPLFALILITAMGALFTAFVANAAVIALMLPAVLIACPGLGLNAQAVTVIMAVSTGLSFALPVSTPAMALAYGTGYVPTRQGVAYGSLLGLLAIPVVVLVAVVVWPWIGLSPFLSEGL
jgi:sodium-dependent dicarboxylate transporter 2/3/5